MGITITATNAEISFFVVLGLIAIPWLCLWGYIGWRLAGWRNVRDERRHLQRKQ